LLLLINSFDDSFTGHRDVVVNSLNFMKAVLSHSEDRHQVFFAAADLGKAGWSGKFGERDFLRFQAVGRVHPTTTAIPERGFRLAFDMVVVRLATPAKVVVFGLSAFGPGALRGFAFLDFPGCF